jgi:hypothetical protein
MNEDELAYRAEEMRHLKEDLCDTDCDDVEEESY